jgi:hypothetical protein
LGFYICIFLVDHPPVVDGEYKNLLWPPSQGPENKEASRIPFAMRMPDRLLEGS